jgi:putative transcriptional regulator
VAAPAARVTNRIRALRFEHGELTQQELADRIGVSRQTLNAIEGSKYSPSLEVAFRIAAVFTLPVDQVFHYELHPSKGAAAMKETTMNIFLPPDLVQYVRERVANGAYASAGEVVSAALRLLQRWEESRGEDVEFDRLRVAEAIAGLRELSRGQTLGKDVTIRDLIDEGRP